MTFRVIFYRTYTGKQNLREQEMALRQLPYNITIHILQLVIYYDYAGTLIKLKTNV
jgi:hypothetical protein